MSMISTLITRAAKEAAQEMVSTVIPQFIQLAAGSLLASIGKTEEAGDVLKRLGLPSDVNTTPEAFQAFLDAQKGKS